MMDLFNELLLTISHLFFIINKGSVFGLKVGEIREDSISPEEGFEPGSFTLSVRLLRCVML